MILFNVQYINSCCCLNQYDTFTHKVTINNNKCIKETKTKNLKKVSNNIVKRSSVARKQFREICQLYDVK